MINNYSLILGIMDTLSDWNDKLNDFTGSHMDNVFVGTLIIGVILAVGFWGIGVLNKK